MLVNVESVRQRVAEIAAMADDDEAAHIAEDQLRAEFILRVAEIGPPELAWMAREVLKTENIKFGRWCA